jgi:hypothetical protein
MNVSRTFKLTSGPGGFRALLLLGLLHVICKRKEADASYSADMYVSFWSSRSRRGPFGVWSTSRGGEERRARGDVRWRWRGQRDERHT